MILSFPPAGGFTSIEKEISRHFICFIKPATKKVSKILRSFLASFILFGTLFVPARAVRADFFSSLSSLFTGDQAYAKTSPNTVSLPKIGDNSQTITLLQANVSSVSILENKDGKDNDVNANSGGNIVSGTSLSPATGPMGVSGEKDSIDYSFDQISVYVVRKGDSISAIADMFGVSTSTILWANDMKKGDKLAEGDTLIILPVSGVIHTILKSQTLAGIAKKYNVDALDIAGFNDIALDSPLTPGDELIIPNAEIVDVPKIKTNNSLKTGKAILKTLIGYFINPVPDYKRISQRIHGNNGVDLAAPTGAKIIASASGTVLLARNGYNGGYGNMVIIKHSNSTQTLYAHQSKIAAKTGDNVSQGEVIGYVGSTGRSTGPHLHYEIHGARNNALDL